MSKALNDTLIDQIKRHGIIAVFSNDELLERLVLKGGNLLDVVYGVSTRASKDLDFSMEGEFNSPEELKAMLAPNLQSSYAAIGLEVFDLEVTAEPPKLSEDRKTFWGGYRIYFKLIPLAESGGTLDREAKRRNAVPLGLDRSTKFRIDISKHEFCGDPQRHLLDGYVIYGYSPDLFVAEKLRAICQQSAQYSEEMQRHRSARARDFVDICCVIDRIGVTPASSEFAKLLRRVFEKKKVPLAYLLRINEDRDFHRGDFASVRDTIKPGYSVGDFDVYFDRVVDFVAQLKSFWDE